MFPGTETDTTNEMNGQTIIIVVSVVMIGLILLVAIISLLVCYLKKRLVFTKISASEFILSMWREKYITGF